MDPATQTLLTSLFAFLPAPYSTYAASAIGLAGILSIIASAIASGIKPPSDASPKWLRTAYKVVTWPALNFNWARNAVVPGMPAVVQTAAKQAAAIAAALPERQVIAGISPTGAAVIATVAPEKAA